MEWLDKDSTCHELRLTVPLINVSTTAAATSEDNQSPRRGTVTFHKMLMQTFTGHCPRYGNKQGGVCSTRTIVPLPCCLQVLANTNNYSTRVLLITILGASTATAMVLRCSLDCCTQVFKVNRIHFQVYYYSYTCVH